MSHALHTTAAIALLARALPAQQPTGAVISGTVRDQVTGAAVAGATISVVGTTHAASSNEQGRYTMAGVPSGVFAIEARRIGFGVVRKDNVRVADGPLTIDFGMNSAPLSLEAVTVSATVDAMSSLKVPFAITKLDAEQMPVPAMGSASAMLQGKVPGATVIRASGEPGAGSFVQLRSPSSPFKDNGPLYVVDGIMLSDNPNISPLTQDIESMDIASIEVIKGAAAAAIYGSRAAGGVISITTNRGKNVALGKSQLTVNQQYGFDNVVRQPKKLGHHYWLVNDKSQWVDAQGNVVPKASRVQDPDGMIDNSYAKTYDNVKQAYRPATNFITTVSLAQSSATTNLNLSFDRNRQPGTVIENYGILRQTFRTSIDHTFRDNLGVSVTGSHSRITDQPSQVNFTTLWQVDPDVNLLAKNSDGSPFRVLADSASTTTNPLYLQHYRDNRTRRARSLISTSGHFNPYGWLTFTGDLGYDRLDDLTDNYTPPGIPSDNDGGVSLGSLLYREDETDSYNGSLRSTMLYDVGGLTTRLTFAGEMQRERDLRFTAQGSNFAIAGLRDLSGALTQTTQSSSADIRTNSGWSNLIFDYNGTFIGDFLFRREGNSLFGRGHRWNNFYRAATSYVMSNSSWWKFGDITNAKLRYSYGTAGTRPDFADQYAVVTAGPAGLVRNDLGNPDLRPEMKYEHEMGLDLVYKNRLSLILTYARSTTKDAIVDVAVPSSTGFNTAERNVGATRGETWEGTVEGSWITRKNFRWSSNIVVDRSRSSVLEYNRPCFSDGILWRCDNIPLASMWGRFLARSANDLPTDAKASSGEFQVNDEGYLVWVGANNKWTDGMAKKLWNTSKRIGSATYRWGEPFMAPLKNPGVNEVDQIGDGQPKFNFGVGNRIDFHGLQLYALFNGQAGGDIYNDWRHRTFATNDAPELDQTGKPDSLKKPFYYYSRGVAQSSNCNSGRCLANFVEKDTYAKLTELSLTYSFTAQKIPALARVGADRLNVQLIGRNLATWTKFSGLDPEAGSVNNRVANAAFPFARNFTTALTLVF